MSFAALNEFAELRIHVYEVNQQEPWPKKIQLHVCPQGGESKRK